jgi:multidrug efflux pump subunit AcrB
MNELHVLLTKAPGGNAEVVHMMVVSAIRSALPNLRWVASYDTTGGSADAIDVVAFQEGEDPDAALQVANGVPGASVELLVAKPSLTLMAPGGGAPGGAPGGPPT